MPCGRGSRAAESEQSPHLEAFALKLDAAGTVQWSWRSGHSGSSDVALSVAELPGNLGVVIVAGYRMVGGTARRSLTQLSLSTGVEA